MSIISKNTFLNKDIVYMRNILVREYDLKDGGFSIIKKNHLLPQEEISTIDRMSKKDKNIYIGKLHFKYKGLSRKLLDGFVEARRMFYEVNDIQDADILSIKKDALFLIDKNVEHLDVSDHYQFSMKNKYTSYMYLKGLEFYYSSYNNEIHVKGISDNKVLLHQNGMIGEIKRFIKLNENLNVNKRILFNKLLDLTNKYKNKKLNVDFYRELNANSMYKSNIIDNFYMDNWGDVDDIDIRYNYTVFVELINCIL